MGFQENLELIGKIPILLVEDFQLFKPPQDQCILGHIDFLLTGIETLSIGTLLIGLIS